MCEALSYVLDKIYIRSGTKSYRNNVRIPMGTNSAPLVADLFLFCYERGLMASISNGKKQAEIIQAFNSTSRELDDLLNIDNPYFEGMVKRIYFIPSSEFTPYLKQIKVILLVTDTIYIFSLQQKKLFRQFIA